MPWKAAHNYGYLSSPSNIETDLTERLELNKYSDPYEFKQEISPHTRLREYLCVTTSGRNYFIRAILMVVLYPYSKSEKHATTNMTPHGTFEHWA